MTFGAQIRCRYCNRRQRAASRLFLRKRLAKHLGNCTAFMTVEARIAEKTGGEALLPISELVEHWIPLEATA